RQQLAGFRLDGLAAGLEPGRAAVLRFVEIDHRGPAPLPASFSMDEEIVDAWVERIGMRPEFLPWRIALALQRFAILGRQAEQFRDAAVDYDDHRIRPVEGACLTC